MITIFSLATLPNTLVIGIPLLTAMYGDSSATLMVQVVVLQCIVWYTILLVFFEFRGAKLLIMEKFPESGGDIASIKVESDVVSLDGHDVLETDAEIGEDGKLHVTVRRSNASRKSVEMFGSFSGAEIYSVSSSAIHSPRGSISNYNQSDIYSIVGFPGGRLSNFSPAADLYSVQWSKGTPRRSNYEDERRASYHVTRNMKPYFPAENPEMFSVTKAQKPPVKGYKNQDKSNRDDNMFVRSTSAPIISKAGQTRPHIDIPVIVSEHPKIGKTREMGRFESEIRGDKERIKIGVDSVAEHHPNTVAIPEEVVGAQMPSVSVMVRLIVLMVWRKLIRNPNTYASIIGLVWALVSFRWHVAMPKIIDQSIKLISNTGLGMAMFSLGLFMALQSKLIACGKSKAALAMVVKFLVGPLVMALSGVIVQLHGTIYHISIVQATLSAGIVPFVFAKEYNVHPTILSTSVIFGMLITVPITIVYYIILQL